MQNKNYVISELMNKISLSDKNKKGQEQLLEELKEIKSVLDFQIKSVEEQLSPKEQK